MLVVRCWFCSDENPLTHGTHFNEANPVPLRRSGGADRSPDTTRKTKTAREERRLAGNCGPRNECRPTTDRATDHRQGDRHHRTAADPRSLGSGLPASHNTIAKVTAPTARQIHGETPTAAGMQPSATQTNPTSNA